MADSLSGLEVAGAGPRARRIADIGAGAGFPGLVAGGRSASSTG